MGLLFTCYFLLVILLIYPVIRRTSPEIFEKLYFWRKEFQGLQGEKRRILKFASRRAGRIISKGVANRFDRLLRLAGYPGGLSAQEWVMIYLLWLAVNIYLALSGTPNLRLPVFLMGVLGVVWHQGRLARSRNERQLYARENIRFLKRRFVYLLRQSIDVTEALRMLAFMAVGKFGEDFKKYMEQTREGNRPLREIMQEFRSQYEVRELDDFCLAIELSDLKSPTILADMIYRQTIDENARVDDYLDQRKDATKTKMTFLIAGSVVWTLGLTIYFAFFGFMDFFKGGGGLFNF